MKWVNWQKGVLPILIIIPALDSIISDKVIWSTPVFIKLT
jgi:hypothetical protein